MRESVVEKYLQEQVKARGGMSEKHVSPGRRGVPDQLVTIPNLETPNTPRMDLVETKRPKAEGGKLRGGQTRDHARRGACGIRVWTLYTKAEVDVYIKVVFGR